MSDAARYIHAILAISSHYPHKFAGTEIYELLHGFLRMARDKWGDDPTIKKLIEKIQEILHNVQYRYTEVKELQVVLDNIREILRNEEGVSGDAVKHRFFEYVNSLELRGGDCLWDIFITGLKRMLQRWGSHLFFAYDDEDIPKTNNQMEQAIKKYKMMIRQLTKKRNTSDVAVRHGIFLVLLLEYCGTENIDLMMLLRDTTPSEYLVVKSTLIRYYNWMREIGLTVNERNRLIEGVKIYT